MFVNSSKISRVKKIPNLFLINDSCLSGNPFPNVVCPTYAQRTKPWETAKNKIWTLRVLLVTERVFRKTIFEFEFTYDFYRQGGGEGEL